MGEKEAFRIYKGREIRLLHIFFVIFGVIFALLWIGMLFNVDGNEASGNPALAAIVFLLYLVLWNFLIRWITQKYDLLVRHKKEIVALSFFIALTLQFLTAYCFKTGGLHELYYTNDAGTFLAQGESLLEVKGGFYASYFAGFRNVRNVMLYMAQLFRLERLLGLQYWTNGALFSTCLKASLAIPVMFYIAEKQFSTKAGFYSIIFYCACLPIFVSSPVFYHITITFIYPLLLLFFYVAALHTKKRGIEIICACGTALVAALGMWMMTTPIIMLFAIMVEVFILGSKKMKCIYVGILAATLLLYTGGMHVADAYQEEKFPYSSAEAEYPPELWIYTGLNPETVGFYSTDARKIYDSAASAAEGRQLLQIAVKDRLQEMGPIGLFVHLYKKSVAEFGTGTYSTEWFLTFFPSYDTIPLKWYPSQEKAGGIYTNLSQGVHIGLMLFVLLGAFGQYRSARRDTERKCFPAPWIALFGLLLATMLNETLPRHIYNFIPIMIICASSGALQAEQWIVRRKA